jgi:hypothetical protein
MRLSHKCIILFIIPLFLFIANVYLSDYVMQGKSSCNGLLSRLEYCASSDQMFYYNLFQQTAVFFLVFSVFVPMGIYVYRTMSKWSFAFFLFPVFLFFSSIGFAGAVIGEKTDCSGLCELGRWDCRNAFQSQVSDFTGMIALISLFAAYILPLVVNAQTREEKNILFP